VRELSDVLRTINGFVPKEIIAFCLDSLSRPEISMPFEEDYSELIVTSMRPKVITVASRRECENRRIRV
jgi:hypothetical protein